MSTEQSECPKCHKKFNGPQGLRMHIRWNHSRVGRSKMLAASRANAAKGRLANRTKRAQENPDLKMKPVRKYRLFGRKKKTTRKYQRRVVAPVTTSNQVEWCPRCRCNIRAVQMAMDFPGA